MFDFFVSIYFNVTFKNPYLNEQIMNLYSTQPPTTTAQEQNQLAQKTVAVVGLGSLGSVAAEQLTRAGICNLILVDNDLVELSNLHRQPFYSKADINKPKVLAAEQKLKKLKSNINIIPHHARLDETNTFLLTSDLVLDCTDNLQTRFIINEYCKEQQLPLIHSAAAGTIGVILPITNTYCFNCIYKNAKTALTCDDIGILNTTSYTTASLQVTEAIKILLNKESTQALIRFDISNNSFDMLKVKKDTGCSVCNNKPSQKEIKQNGNEKFLIVPCTTRSAYSAKTRTSIKLNLNKIKENFETIIDTPVVLVVKDKENTNTEIIIHNYGEIVFKNISDQNKMKELAEKIYAIAT